MKPALLFAFLSAGLLLAEEAPPVRPEMKFRPAHRGVSRIAPKENFSPYMLEARPLSYLAAKPEHLDPKAVFEQRIPLPLWLADDKLNNANPFERDISTKAGELDLSAEARNSGKLDKSEADSRAAIAAAVAEISANTSSFVIGDADNGSIVLDGEIYAVGDTISVTSKEGRRADVKILGIAPGTRKGDAKINASVATPTGQRPLEILLSFKARP